MNNIEAILPALKKLYPENIFDKQVERYKDLDHKFIDKFGEAECSLFSTPGRVELGGNHTDHNNGKVLAASIDLDSIAIVSPISDKIITIFSEGYENPFVIKLDDL